LDWPLGSGVLLLAVEGHQLLTARYLGAGRTGAGGQHQLTIGKLPLPGHHNTTSGIDTKHGAMGHQRDALLLGKVPAAQPGHSSCGATSAHHVAEIRLVVLVAAVGRDETNGLLGIQLAQALDQLLGSEAAADHQYLPADADLIQSCCAHTQASTPQGSNTSLPMPQPGQRKLSGTRAQGVPGATS